MSIWKILGRNPAGKDLESAQRSPNYKNGCFQNISETVTLSKDASYLKASWDFINRPKNTVPPKPLPSVKTDLKALYSDKPAIIWFGHSSYLVHYKGINILVDPVFSGNASPLSFSVRSFPGSDIYRVEDLPDIDILIITHDHYDHMDYRTILKLKSKTKQVCTSLGVASHLTHWGYDAGSIQEFDWWDTRRFANGVEITAFPTRHFSGRTLVRSKTLWSGFIIRLGTYSIVAGADSGYDPVFKLIGDKYGPFDIALLESGQYNADWAQIHMMPEETVQASIDLKARVLLPVHWAKFAIALHPWDEPIKRVTAKALEMKVKITTPMIGEPVILDESYPLKNWWL